MKNKKIHILLPEGIGLRNFAYSHFPKIAKENGFELKYWNATEFDYSELNLHAIKLEGKPHFKTDLMKRARKQIEIKQFSKRFQNDIYKSYSFKTKPQSVKQLVKKLWVDFLTFKYQNNLKQLRENIKNQERQTQYYKDCLSQLKFEQPDLVFCTNQRPVNAIAPILTCQDLGIPTATFIFSWDNLPKATMVIEPDYYLVWSNHMAKELQDYYPYIQKQHIKITGSPQFELHFDHSHLKTRKAFFKTYHLDLNKQYICFSGDDITTSPHDPEYLRDVLEAVKDLNTKGQNLAVIFRPCPVDFSIRYDKILDEFSEIVVRIRPEWTKKGDIWNSIFPKPTDQTLLYNTIHHSDLVINLGSSMVFDAVCHEKPCAYVNYNPNVEVLKKDVKTIYRYVHFQSMSNKSAVIWLNSKAEITDKILEGLNNPKPYVENAKIWFEKINKQPARQASERIVEALNDIIK